MDNAKYKLHTDVMLERPNVKGISITVLQHDYRWRVTEIRVQNEGGWTTDTYATTLLTPCHWSNKVWIINDKLRRSSIPMGTMFMDNGAAVRQNRRLLLLLPKLVEIEIYEFFADSILYGRVVEIRRCNQRRPNRHWLGSYDIVRFLGITPATFTGWLNDQKPNSWHKIVIAIAQVGGIPSDIVLLVRVLIHARSVKPT